MLEDLYEIHNEIMSTIPRSGERYLYSQINWESSGLCITGDRGVGKTTMICQDLLRRYRTPHRALYISADHIKVLSLGLVNIAKRHFEMGGQALYIDEVHKYPDWSVEIKNILDTYKKHQIVFSASSSLDLNKSKGDLSRRVVYHKLLGFSFREYLAFAEGKDLPVLALEELFENHLQIASKLEIPLILKYFKDYLNYGYYPFFLEGVEDFFPKLSNVIEKVLFEDIAVVYNLKQTTLPVLKKIVWLVATSNGLIPNIDKMSKNLSVSRELVYNCLEYLNHSGLLNDVLHPGKGNNLVRKPGKLYLNNSNLLSTINRNLKHDYDVGSVRETFFVNQMNNMHKIRLHDKGDFLVDDQWILEIGGKNKNDYQVRNQPHAFLVLDDLKTGFDQKIPLYLFGFLY
jgi:predicted AAA+ superfamily ATPase